MSEMKKSKYHSLRFRSLLLSTMILTACAQADVPGNRNVNIPSPTYASERQPGINEKPDSVTYLPLGKDVLIPQAGSGAPLPDEIVGPFELRGETLAGALQLILSGYDIPIAFQTDQATSRTITVTNLKGPINEVVPQICGLADLYCAYERGVLTVKDNEVFTVAIPPIGEGSELMTQVAAALQSIVGGTPIIDTGTRTIVYTATNRSAQMAQRYFQRMRAGTAMIVYETYIWEVTLDNGNSAGINWRSLDQFGRFNVGIDVAGTVSPALGNPISIGLPTTGSTNFSTGDVLRFISTYGAVKTISQPQITVMSGSSARLRVAETQNYVSSISRTTDDNGDDTVATETDSVDTGFTLEINSSWDNATVYGNFKILLEENLGIDTFDDNPDAIVQLPRTTEREVETNVRVRPGDSVLIAGLVRETDQYDKSGLGLEKPILPVERSAISSNSELVVLLRPRVVAFVSPGEQMPNQNEVTPPLESMLSQQLEPEFPEKAAPLPEAEIVAEPINSAPSAPVEVPAVETSPAALKQKPQTEKSQEEKVQVQQPSLPVVRATPAPVIAPAPQAAAQPQAVQPEVVAVDPPIEPPEMFARDIEPTPTPQAARAPVQPTSSSSILAPPVPPADIGYPDRLPEPLTPVPSSSRPIGVIQ